MGLAPALFEHFLASFAVSSGTKLFAELADCQTRGKALQAWQRDGFQAVSGEQGARMVLSCLAPGPEEIRERQQKHAAHASVEPVYHVQPIAPSAALSLAAKQLGTLGLHYLN